MRFWKILKMISNKEDSNNNKVLPHNNELSSEEQQTNDNETTDNNQEVEERQDDINNDQLPEKESDTIEEVKDEGLNNDTKEENNNTDDSGEGENQDNQNSGDVEDAVEASNNESSRSLKNTQETDNSISEQNLTSTSSSNDNINNGKDNFSNNQQDIMEKQEGNLNDGENHQENDNLPTEQNENEAKEEIEELKENNQLSDNNEVDYKDEDIQSEDEINDQDEEQEVDNFGREVKEESEEFDNDENQVDVDLQVEEKTEQLNIEEDKQDNDLILSDEQEITSNIDENQKEKDNSSIKQNESEAKEEKKENIDEEQEEKSDELASNNLERELISGQNDMPTESIEEEYDLSNANQELMSKLNKLEPFKNRQRGAGYSIDINSTTEVPNSVIRTLVTKFLNQRFTKKETDLNIRSNSLEETSGFHKWDIKSVITHLETQQLTKVLNDKYGYQYASGKNETVPLSFYFDMSGSMSSYTNMLAVIAIELLKKDIKVLVGFNETVHYQIDSIRKAISVEELATALKKAGNDEADYNHNIKMKKISKNIDNFLLSSKAEKCVVFSDFDPLDEVVNLSHGCNVYWFCFESNFNRDDLLEYNGFLYKVKNIADIAKGLIKVNEYRFQTLCYLEKDKVKTKTH